MSADHSGQPERAEFVPITGADGDRFVSWCNDRDFLNGPDIANKDVLSAFDGFSIGDLKWLCQAMIQAQTVPDLATMQKAALARDVAVLRSGDRDS